ncbi:MAG: dockerin type I domain-containing protein, partial [Oscillospiraceae bacterium]|nr:dockerin type I domain-containing protein [Oscillospiraceae bacterium]
MRKKQLVIFGKILCLMLSLAVLAGALGIMPLAQAEEENSFVPGDVNGNGEVDIGDARLVLQHLVEKITLTGRDLIAADVDGKGVSITSARLILQFLVDKIDGFPGAAYPPIDPPNRRPANLPTLEGKLEEATVAVIKDRENFDTFTNPLDLGYMYNDHSERNAAGAITKLNFVRESADPACIVYKNEYYLFASHGAGYWWSPDLANWEFIYVDKSGLDEINKWAPGACVVGDTLYITHSESGAIYKTTDPKSGKWTRVGKPIDWGDPAL